MIKIPSEYKDENDFLRVASKIASQSFFIKQDSLIEQNYHELKEIAIKNNFNVERITNFFYPTNKSELEQKLNSFVQKEATNEDIKYFFPQLSMYYNVPLSYVYYVFAKMRAKKSIENL
jgi:hypothetical protein